MRNRDVPSGEEGMPGSPDAVMHASVKLGDGFLMGSDDPSGDGGPKVGSAVAYTGKDPSESERVFNALCEGGETTMPFGQTFWSQGFGMCTDRFGVPWMVDTAGEPPSS